MATHSEVFSSVNVNATPDSEVTLTKVIPEYVFRFSRINTVVSQEELGNGLADREPTSNAKFNWGT